MEPHTIMKHIHQTIAAITRPVAALTITIAALMSFSSCEKEDPNVDTGLAAEKFTLSAHERRCQNTDKTFDWTISASGKTDSIDEEIDDMYVTSVNELTLNSTAPVNVVSTNTAAVAVQKLSATSYRLTYVYEGEADIQVWNGGKNFNKGTNKTQFHVTAKSLVMPEYAVFLLELNGQYYDTIKAKFFDERGWQAAMDNFCDHHLHATPWAFTSLTLPLGNVNEVWGVSISDHLYHIKFIGLEPENTSFRLTTFNTDGLQIDLNEDYDHDYLGPFMPAHKSWKTLCAENGLDISSWLTNETTDYANLKKEYFFNSYSSNDLTLCTISVIENGKTRMTGIPVNAKIGR